MYIYESHMGGLYVSDDDLSYEELHCEECGDTDTYVGYADTKEEAWKLLEPCTDIDGSGGYSYEYIQKFLKNWD